MAGLFFCLASAEGAGLLFCHAAIQHHTSVYGAFCSVNATIPHTTQNSAQSFTGAFPAIRRILLLLCDGASGYTAMIRHVGAYHSAEAPPAHTRYRRHARTLHRSAQPPYYNKVYKGAGVRPLLWIHARQCSISQTMPTRRGQRLHLYRVSPAAISMLPTPGGLRSDTGSAVRKHRLAPYTRLGSPAEEARRAARNNWRLSPQLFSGFRPIANRGQQ